MLGFFLQEINFSFLISLFSVFHFSSILFLSSFSCWRWSSGGPDVSWPESWVWVAEAPPRPPVRGMNACYPCCSHNGSHFQKGCSLARTEWCWDRLNWMCDQIQVKALCKLCRFWQAYEQIYPSCGRPRQDLWVPLFVKTATCQPGVACCFSPSLCPPCVGANWWTSPFLKCFLSLLPIGLIQFSIILLLLPCLSFYLEIA